MMPTNVTMEAIRRLGAFVARLRAEARGNVAMITGLCMPVVVMLTLGGVDVHRASTVRMNLQDALDAAALSAARSPYTDNVDLQRVGMTALTANLKAYPEITLRPADTSFVLVDEEVVVAKAKVDVKAIVANIVLPPYGQLLDDTLPVGAHSEVNRATKDLEVSLVLDITGSMDEGSRMADLQQAAKDLVDLVVQDEQSINSTRMSLAPYSMGVNAGSFLNTVRGAARGPTAITGASWATTDSQKTITAITTAASATFTSNGHGLVAGNFIWMTGVKDNDGTGDDLSGWLNSKVYKVKAVTSNTFTLQRANGANWVDLSTSGYEAYTNSGKVQKCQTTNCQVVVTSNNHGLNTGDDVRISNVSGMTQINTQTGVSPSGTAPFSLTTTRLTNNTFIVNVVGPTTSSFQSGAGAVQCLEYGCLKYRFTNNDGNLRVYDASSCVSERVGDEAYTDAAPSTAPVRFSYVGTTNVAQGGCMGTTFTPLTTDRNILKTAIGGYTPEGGTAGQIGVAWGWYLVSPTFANASLLTDPLRRPAAYGTRNLLKVVIIMTDGEFNAVYSNGVRARDSGTGGGSNDRWINQNSDNGNPFRQSARLCDAMKAQGIIIYTVGFDISESNDPTPTVNGVQSVDTSEDVMQYCATNPSHVYLPQNGTSLKSAFGAIGRSISQLRISK